MNKTAIIIPARLKAKRFPGKPLVKINNLPMIIHVMNRAKESQVGEVLVATPDKEILDIIKQYKGEAIFTKDTHFSGSDRVYEAYSQKLRDKVDLIINLQGDMPNIKPNSIKKLEKFMRSNKCDIGTLASNMVNEEEYANPNIVKVSTDKELKDNEFVKAQDFFRIRNDLKNEKIYHHIGIYAFTNVALTKYVELSRSKLEIDRNLEQMRAIENNMTIKVGWTDSLPLGIDTESDLKKILAEIKE